MNKLHKHYLQFTSIECQPQQRQIWKEKAIKDANHGKYHMKTNNTPNFRHPKLIQVLGSSNNMKQEAQEYAKYLFKTIIRKLTSRNGLKKGGLNSLVCELNPILWKDGFLELFKKNNLDVSNMESKRMPLSLNILKLL